MLHENKRECAMHLLKCIPILPCSDGPLNGANDFDDLNHEQKTYTAVNVIYGSFLLNFVSFM